jgi:hypothetical protein
LPRQNPSKIYSPQDASQSEGNRFFARQAKFFEEYMIFKKNLVQYCGKDIPSDLAGSIPVRLTGERYGI